MDLETDVDLEGGKTDVTTNFSVVATKFNPGAPSVVNKYGFSSLKLPNYYSKSKTKLKKNVIQSGLGGEDIILSEDCDWLSVKTSYNLTANEKPGMGKRKREVANEMEGKHTLISYLEMH